MDKNVLENIIFDNTKSIFAFFLNKGIDENDLFSKSIEYVDIPNIEKIIETRRIPFPYELTFKNSNYAHQNEVRFYITSENK